MYYGMDKTHQLHFKIGAHIVRLKGTIRNNKFNYEPQSRCYISRFQCVFSCGTHRIFCSYVFTLCFSLPLVLFLLLLLLLLLLFRFELSNAKCKHTMHYVMLVGLNSGIRIKTFDIALSSELNYCHCCFQRNERRFSFLKISFGRTITVLVLAKQDTNGTNCRQ